MHQSIGRTHLLQKVEAERDLRGWLGMSGRLSESMRPFRVQSGENPTREGCKPQRLGPKALALGDALNQLLRCYLDMAYATDHGAWSREEEETFRYVLAALDDAGIPVSY